MNRREFVKIVGLSGAALAVGLRARGAESVADQAASEALNSMTPKVPRRKFGATGVEVPILALGGIFDIPTNQLVLEKAFDYGVRYWDTAYSYGGGRSEAGMGIYFERHPERREEIFLVTKTGARNPQEMTAQLEESLRRLQTDYVDLYFLHGVSDPQAFTDEIRTWAEKTKKAGKIKFFGFSTHSNMEECVAAAAKLGWIDGIMLTYNYRIMNTDRMKAAIESAAKAGIGLTAMKTQARPARRGESQEQDREANAQEAMVAHFTARGFTPEQAKMKIVWETKEIASICSAMYTVTVLQANVMAALDRKELTEADRSVLFAEAAETCSGYCAGCSRICEGAIGYKVPVSTMMRGLMYRNSYGDLELARETVASGWQGDRAVLGMIDFRAAEQVCPNRLPIAKLVKEAAELFA